MMQSTTQQTRRHFLKCHSCNHPWAIDVLDKAASGRFAHSHDGKLLYYADHITLQRAQQGPCPCCGESPGAHRFHKHMGRVGPSGARLVSDAERCPCDGRCTNARGPKCDCACGGANHGTRRLVRVTIDAGPAPREAVSA